MTKVEIAKLKVFIESSTNIFELIRTEEPTRTRETRNTGMVRAGPVRK